MLSESRVASLQSVDPVFIAYMKLKNLLIPICLCMALTALAAVPAQSAQPQSGVCANVSDMAPTMMDAYSDVADGLAINALLVIADVALDPDGQVSSVSVTGSLPEIEHLVQTSLAKLQCRGNGQNSVQHYHIQFHVADDPPAEEALDRVMGVSSPVPDQDTPTIVIAASGPGQIYVNQQVAADRHALHRLLQAQQPGSRLVIWGADDLSFSALADTLTELRDDAMDMVTFDVEGRAVFAVLGPEADRRMASDYKAIKHVRVDVGPDGRVWVNGKKTKAGKAAKRPSGTGLSVELHLRGNVSVGVVTREVDRWASQPDTWVRLVI